MISTYPTRAKVANLRRDPAATVLIHSDDWDGPYVQLDGTAEVIDLPDSVEPLVDYFRSISGEHPDWDEYRQAMRDQGKSLIRVTIEQWGPIATGGFPPELADRVGCTPGRAAGHLLAHARRRGVGRDQLPAARAEPSAASTAAGWSGTTPTSTGRRASSRCARPGTTSSGARSSSTWARSLPRMLNSAAVFEWNTDKAYLTQLADAGVPVVPTVVVERERGPPRRRRRLRPRRGQAVRRCRRPGRGGARRVVRRRSRTSAPVPGWCSRSSSRCAPRARPRSSSSTARSSPRPRSARPRASSASTRVRRHDGRPCRSPTRRPTLARRAVAAAEAILGERLDYARVDQMRLADGTLAVSELEVTEPGLYLEVLPDNAAAFADLVAGPAAHPLTAGVRARDTEGCPAVLPARLHSSR